MLRYPLPAEYLAGPALTPDPRDPQARRRSLDALSAYLDQLRPDNCRVTVVGRAIAGADARTAPYYGTRFTTAPLDDEARRLLADPAGSVRAGEELRLPRPNAFLPRSLALVAPPLLPGAVSEPVWRAALREPPVVARRDDRWTVWHKLDRCFALPKVRPPSPSVSATYFSYR